MATRSEESSHSVNAEPDNTHPQQPSTPVTPVFPPVNTNTVVSSHADHPMSKQENVSLTNNPDKDMAAPGEPDNKTQKHKSVIDVKAIYHMSQDSSIPQGYCIIINNNTLKYDEESMETIRGVFSDQLGFHVQVYNDLTRKGIKHLLERVANVDHTDLYCLVVIVLSKGEKERAIYGSDGKKLQLKELMMWFSSDASPTLEGKPQLFFTETQLNKLNDAQPIEYPEIPQTYIASYFGNFADERKPMLEIIKTMCSNTTLQESLATHDRDDAFNKKDNLESPLHFWDCTSAREKRYNMELRLALEVLYKLRNATITKLEQERKNIFTICQNARRSRIAGSVTSLTGGALAIIGLGLIPVTLGGSIALSVVGVGVGVAGGAVSITSAVTDKVMSKGKLKEAKAIIDIDKQLTEQVNSLIKKMPQEMPQESPASTKEEAVTVVFQGRQIIRTVAVTASTGTGGAQVAKSAFLGGLFALRVTGSAARGVAIARRVATALKVPLDLGELIYNSEKLYKKSETEAKKWFDEQLELLCTQQKEIEELLQGNEMPTETAEEVSQESEEVSQESKEVSQESEEVSQESEEVSQESEEVSQESEEVSQESEEVSQKSEEVSQESGKIEKLLKGNEIPTKELLPEEVVLHVEGGGRKESALSLKSLTGSDVGLSQQKKIEKLLEENETPTEELPEEVVLHSVLHVEGGGRTESAPSLTSLTSSDGRLTQEKKVEKLLEMPTEELLPEEVILHVEGGGRMESAFSLTPLTGSDGDGGLLMKTHAEKGAFGYLKELTVTSSGMTYHCSQYGVTLIIPEGTIEDSATVWFGASLYSDKFHFGDYVPVTPIVWVYIDQKLMKPAELYLPHHIDVADQSTKNKLSLLIANDEEFLKKGSLIFTSNNNFVMEVESALCKTYCHHFCSHCAGIKKIAYEDARKQCILAVAKKQEDSITLLVHFCIFPFQPACKEVVKKQYTENGFTVNYSKAITFEDNGCITPKFDPDDGIVGWERDYDGIYSDDKILEKEVDYIEVMGWKGKDVSKNEIKKLEELESDMNYPPRLRFQFVCTNQALAKKATKVKATLFGSTPLLKDTITLKRPDYDPSLSDLSATPDETADNSDDSQFESDSLLLELLLVVIAFKEHHGKWFAFGLALGLSHSRLRYIEPQLNKPEQYFRELLILWRRQNPTASWEPIARAFRKIHLEDAAIQLESRFQNTVGIKTSEAQATATTTLDVKNLQNVLETLDESLFDSTKWHRLGLALGLSSMTLNLIVDKHLLRTIEAWLRCQDDVGEKGGATWQNLIIAVGKVGDNAAAKKIQEKLKIND